jgi:16S rRNA processing protein RimM
VEHAQCRVTLGRIVGVFGVRGWVRVQSYTRPPDNLKAYRSWWIASAQPYEAKIIEVREHGGAFVASLSDAEGIAIDDRDVAAALVGSDIQVERSALPQPPPGSYYWADLVGLEVKTVSGVRLGAVENLVDNGAQDVLVVADGGTKRLIPFVRGPIIRSVDLDDGLIVADWEPDY